MLQAMFAAFWTHHVISKRVLYLIALYLLCIKVVALFFLNILCYNNLELHKLLSVMLLCLLSFLFLSVFFFRHGSLTQ